MIKNTKCWVEQFVIGLNLCPFAARPWQQGQVRIIASQANNDDALYQDYLEELNILIQKEEEDVATTLLATPNHLQDFTAYLGFLDIAQHALIEARLDGTLQLASFHPDYLFEGEPEGDLSHFTNRAPYPILHLLRESQLTAAVQNHPNPQAIPANNMSRLEALGLSGIQKILHPCSLEKA